MSDPKHVQLFHIENLAKLQYFTAFISERDDIRPLTAAFRINSELPPTPDALFFEGKVGDIVLPIGFMGDWEDAVKEMDNVGLFFNFPSANGPPVGSVGLDHPTNMDLVSLSDLRAGKGWGIMKNQPQEPNWAFLDKKLEEVLPVAKLVYQDTGRLPLTYILKPKELDIDVSVMSVARSEFEKERATLRMATLVGYSSTDFYATLSEAERRVKTQGGEDVGTPPEKVLNIVIVHKNGEKITCTVPIDNNNEDGCFRAPEIVKGFGNEMFGRLTCLFDLAPRGRALERCLENYGEKLKKMVIPEEMNMASPPLKSSGATILKFPTK